MKILQFAGGGDIGGAKTHILALSKALSQEHDIKLVCFRRESFSAEARALGLSVLDMNHGPNILADIKEALRIVEAEKPDLIHCHGARANLVGTAVKKRTGIPLITTVHSDPRMDYLGSFWKRCTLEKMNIRALKKMDGYVAVSDAMADTLIERGTDPQKIYTIFNGLDFTGCEEGKPEKGPEEPVVVGIAARLTAVKDIGTLLKAFALAEAADKRLVLRIAGTGEDEKLLKDQCRKLGIEDKVIFEGWISDIAAFYKGVDINVLSSLSEGFPYSLLEGAQQHCAAIATNVGGIPTIIDNEENGLLFTPGDAEKLSEHLLRMAGDGALRTRMAEALFEKASREFSLSRMADKQKSVYKRVLRKMTMTGRRGAVLCGAYGRGNAGDEAILNAILTKMRGIDEDMPLWVMSRNRKETCLANRVKSFYIFNIPAFLRNLKKAKIFINGGGSLIQDVTSSRSLFFYLFTLKMARRCGCRVIMYGCGIGPIKKPGNRKLAAKVLNETAEIITLRDAVSLEELKKMGVDKPEIVLAADPTVNLKPASALDARAAFCREGIPADAPKIGFCIRSWPGFDQRELLAAAADYAYEKHGLIPVFIPAELPKDDLAQKKVMPFIKAPCYCSSSRHDAEELMAMLGSMKAVVAMRLHALVFATMGGAPVVGISYDVKVDSFLKSIHSDASLPLEGLTLETLCREIDLAVSEGQHARVLAAAEELKRMECKNGEAAMRLLDA